MLVDKAPAHLYPRAELLFTGDDKLIKTRGRRVAQDEDAALQRHSNVPRPATHLLRALAHALLWTAIVGASACGVSGGVDLPRGGGLRFAAIADYGVDDENELSVARLVKGWKPDFLITLGDNNYEAGLASTIDDNIGKYYSEFIGGYAGSYGPGGPTNRFWPCVGNHDWYAQPGGSMQPYLDYFHALPGNKRYYDFVVGDVHFFSVDSDAHEPDGMTATSTQAAWLEARLGAATECFKIVYFHHPPYSSGPAMFTVPEMRWPFREWGADLVLTGHQHQYERLEVGGMTYVVAGLGGALNRFDFSATQAESLVRYNADFGALRADVTQDGLAFEFRDTKDQLVDAFTLNKRCP